MSLIGDALKDLMGKPEKAEDKVSKEKAELLKKLAEVEKKEQDATKKAEVKTVKVDTKPIVEQPKVEAQMPPPPKPTSEDYLVSIHNQLQMVRQNMDALYRVQSEMYKTQEEIQEALVLLLKYISK